MSCATMEVTRVGGMTFTATRKGGMTMTVTKVCPVELEPPTPDEPSDDEDE